MTESRGDFLLNSRGIDFGVRHCGTPVGNVVLPPWAASPEDFVNKLNQALESDHVSRLELNRETDLRKFGKAIFKKLEDWKLFK